MYARFFALIAAFGAVMVYAQDDSTVTGTDVAPSDASATSRSDPPFPTSDISPCPLACLIPIAAANNCTSFTDRHCVCDSTTPVTVQVTACMQANCTQKELDNGAKLQQLLCPTTSGTSTNSSTGNSTDTGSSPTDTVSSDDSGAKLFTASGVVAAVGGLVL